MTCASYLRAPFKVAASLIPAFSSCCVTIGRASFAYLE